MIAQLYPLLLALLILAVLSALLIYRWRQTRRQAARRQDQLKRAAYRRQRMATLQELVGDDVLALQRVHAEAQRLNVSPSSLKALNAAIEHARQAQEETRPMEVFSTA